MPSGGTGSGADGGPEGPAAGRRGRRRRPPLAEEIATITQWKQRRTAPVNLKIRSEIDARWRRVAARLGYGALCAMLEVAIDRACDELEELDAAT